MMRNFPILVEPSVCHLLLIFQVDINEVANPRVIKKDFRALGKLAKGSGAQVPSSILLVAVNSVGRNRKNQLFNPWLKMPWGPRRPMASWRVSGTVFPAGPVKGFSSCTQPDEVTPRVLCPVLGPSFQKRHCGAEA